MEQSSLTDLIDLARDPDPAARQALSQRITDICLLEKTGGKSGAYSRQATRKHKE